MMVRWVYSRSKAERRASEMGSEGLRERAAGGSRSSTVAWERGQFLRGVNFE